MGLMAIAALGAALSLLVSGFVFGTNNNIFHLPIIGRLYDEPQFQTDTYMQSLRFYAAGPFQMLQGVDRYIDPSILFLCLAYFSRLLTFIGFLACGRLLGVTSRRDRLLFAVLLAFTSLLQGFSFAGHGGLFIYYFTHSEITNGLSLLAIYYAVQGRLATAFAINGVTFFTNAFVAVWNAIPLGLVICLLLFCSRITLTQTLTRGGIGLALFLVLASPVIANIWSNPEFAQPITFDYKEFLTEYYPLHFLFGSNSWLERVGLAVVSVTGLLAFITLARRADGFGPYVFLAALLGYMTVYATGIVAPSLSGSALILNLHLLRVSGSIHLFAALGSVTLATMWLTSRESRESRVFGPLLTVALCSLKSVLALAPVILASALASGTGKRLPARLVDGIITQVALVIVLLGFWSYIIWKNERLDGVFRARIAEWADVGGWARRNTPANAVFLIADENDSEIFEYASQRRLWITWKRGAAVMWLPSYYSIWHARLEEIQVLASLDQRLEYAARNGVRYVIDGCVERRPVLFRGGRLCVFDAKPGLSD